MPRLSLERHVPHSPARMYDLVADLESYPRFVPNCQAMQVTPGEAEDVRFARMTIRFGPIADSYTSRVTLNADDRSIGVKAIDGPFRYLDSRWTFEPEGQGTCVRFAIDFKFSNLLIAAVAEPAFASKQDEILDAFLLEAERRYA